MNVVCEGERKDSDMSNTNNEERLEDMFADVEAIIAHMEEDISIDEAFGAYEQGMRTLKMCNDKIDKIEKKILVLNEQGSLEEF